MAELIFAVTPCTEQDRHGFDSWPSAKFIYMSTIKKVPVGKIPDGESFQVHLRADAPIYVVQTKERVNGKLRVIATSNASGRTYKFDPKRKVYP